MNHVLNGTHPQADAALLAAVANAPDVHGVGFGVETAPVTDYNRGRMLRVSGTGETATAVAIREGRNIDDVLRGWAHADRDYSDAETRPDAFDGGCPADCQPLTKRPVGPVAPLPATIDAGIDAIKAWSEINGMYRAIKVLRAAGITEAPAVVRMEIDRFAAENGVTL